MRALSTAGLILTLVATACGDDRGDNLFGGEGMSGAEGDVATGGSGAASGAQDDNGGTSDGVDSGASEPKYDIDPTGNPGGGDACGGGDDGGASDPGDCTDEAPPDSFEPEIQWTFDAPGESQSAVIPLVGNFTDDNADGAIDLCDTPDLVVVAFAAVNGEGHIYVLDGATGAVHLEIPDGIDPSVTPAIGDIDGDGVVEIVTALRQTDGLIPNDHLVAFEHDGTVKWISPDPWALGDAIYSAIAMADLDNDGDVEIMGGSHVHDHTGKRLWTTQSSYALGYGTATAAADLDGDGDLEVVLGHAAYHHDGAQYYLAPGLAAGYPQIADLDADPEPEILVTNPNGLTLLEHTGQVKYKDLRPTGDAAGGTTWAKPATVHDFDGDQVAEFATGSANNYTVYRGDASILWKAPVADLSGSAAGTAFDFLGDGKAEAMYADEQTFHIYDEGGTPYLSVPRSSGTIIEYPVVADLDADGSAEIAVVSMDGPMGGQTAPTVQVIRDKEDRWIQARRIWNQHTYHVTNVNEDGTIPQFEQPSWKALNTYRTNAQIDDGGVCRPVPQG